MTPRHSLVMRAFGLGAWAVCDGHSDCRKGRRPSFTDAGPPELAERLYRVFVEAIAERNIPVATGMFREQMEVELVNDGPVTLWLDTDEWK